MKNKLDPALLGGPYLFNEIKKDSHETIPLKICTELRAAYLPELHVDGDNEQYTL
jgi:hypothetical protein